MGRAGASSLQVRRAKSHPDCTIGNGTRVTLGTEAEPRGIARPPPRLHHQGKPEMISLITRGSADHGRHCGAADIHRMLKMLRCPDVNLAAEYESEASYCGAAFRCRRRPIGGPTQDRQGARPRNTADAARAGRRGHRMREGARQSWRGSAGASPVQVGPSKPPGSECCVRRR